MSQSEIEQPAESPEEQVDAQPETLPEVEAQPEALPSGETVAVSFSAEEILGAEAPAEPDAPMPVENASLLATLEAIIYVTDEPLTADQIAEAIEQPRERIIALLEQLCAEYDKPERGLSIREIAGGFRMTTKPEHHESVRRFVRNLNPPMKLSLPALETLAVIAYKQPITAPEIMEIRGVQGAGVLKTLLDRKLIAPAGRKQVIGKPILYKTTKEFLVQFGLKNLNELPTLKEFQEIGSLGGGEPEAPAQANLIEMPAPPDTEDSAAETEDTESQETAPQETEPQAIDPQDKGPEAGAAEPETE
ncbi:MAG TPA: SMC-Scp complex subunit ScpB [Bryobacteraceae bacterium]|jgi:segregation and condensation protein B|nr:SMC-Scp complex subunit ScpB [Bryobacteraceae bacterium]